MKEGFGQPSVYYDEMDTAILLLLAVIIIQYQMNESIKKKNQMEIFKNSLIIHKPIDLSNG